MRGSCKRNDLRYGKGREAKGPTDARLLWARKQTRKCDSCGIRRKVRLPLRSENAANTIRECGHFEFAFRTS